MDIGRKKLRKHKLNTLYKSGRRNVIEFLAEYGYISRQEALEYFGIQNLADTVMRLRRSGWQIDKTFVICGGRRICLYTMDEYALINAVNLGELVEVEGRYEAPFEP